MCVGWGTGLGLGAPRSTLFPKLRIFAGWRWAAPRLLNGRNSVFSERNQLANLTRVLRFGGRLVTSSAPGIGEREEQKRVGSDRRRNSLSERGGSRSCGLRPQ